MRGQHGRFMKFKAAAPFDALGQRIWIGATVKIRTGIYAGYFGIVVSWANRQVVIDIPSMICETQRRVYESDQLEMPGANCAPPPRMVN